MYSKQKSLNFGHYVPNDKVLNKKVPDNPKYKHVKPAIDTGKNVRTHIDELKEKQKNCIYKKEEVFKRIKFLTFIRLVLCVAEEVLTDENEIVNEPNSTDTPKASEAAGRRCVSNVLMGIGELDIVNDKKKIRSTTILQPKLIPYLLLDVRDRDDFNKCHIVTAKHYPSTMLSRSTGYDTEDMKLFKKNVQHKLIILYDDDESISTRVATTLVERGYENIYLLTGGLKLALEICPHNLTTSSQMLTPVHMLTQNTASVAPKHVKEFFSQEDVEILKQYVEPYFTRGNNSVQSSTSFHSAKFKSAGSSTRSCFDATSTVSHSTTRSRRDSSCSSSTTRQRHPQSASSKSSRLPFTYSNSIKNVEPTHLKPVVSEKANKILNKPKKAPWK